jgi:hypothetical protein
MTRIPARTTDECQTERGDDFPEREICAKKLSHRRVKKRPAKASVAVAVVGRIVTGWPFLYRSLVGEYHAL